MKTYRWLLVALLLTGGAAHAQSLTGNWQVTSEKSCFQAEMKESDTEKELLPMMSSSSSGPAKKITFSKNGKGEECIFSRGKRKGTGLEPFRYKQNGSQLLFLDPKSGTITESWIIEELTDGRLVMHNEKKDCEGLTLTRIP